MSTQNADDWKGQKLFEINLIADRVAKLRRRQVLEHCGSLMALLLMGAGGVLFLVALMHVTAAIGHSSGIARIENELEQEKRLYEELDALRHTAIEQLDRHPLLVPLAEARVNWAAKLAQMARALPPGMGIAKVEATSGDLFVEPPKPLPEPTKSDKQKSKTKRKPVRRKPTRAPEMVFSVMYLPSVNVERDPISSLLGRLRGSGDFMDKMDFVRLEAAREEVWKGFKVIFFRGLLKGAPRTNET